MAFPTRYAGLRVLILATFDCLCAFCAYVLAAHQTLPTGGGQSFRQHFLGHVAYLVVFMVVWCGTATDRRLFLIRRGETPLGHLLGVAKAVVVALIFSGFVVAFFGRHGIQQEFLLRFGGFSLAFLLLFRSLVRAGLIMIRRRGFNRRQILLVGANDRARKLVDLMLSSEQYGYELVGLVDDEPNRVEYLKGYNVPHVGRLEELEEVLTRHVVDEVYITLPVRTYYGTITSMAHLCEGVGVPVRLIADLFPLRIATSKVYQLEDIPLLSLSPIPEAYVQLFVKRAVDLVGSALGLVLICSWLFPIVAVLIWLDSKGPIFFRQERVGLNQRRFHIIKFRSMVPEAEQLKNSLAALNEADGPVFKMRRDPRVTRVGRFLRKTSIDELPQLINVFLGHMSLVGPRPPLASEVEQYTWDQRRRLSVRPGITGLQQVSGRSDVTFQQWIDLDLHYIDTWSLAVDFRILFKTLRVVLMGKGAA